MKEILYSGPKLVIKSDGIRIRKEKLTIPYPEISSVTIKKAHVTRGWLGMLLLGIILDIVILYLLYQFVVNVYDLSDLHGGHFHYPRRSSGMVLGILLALPIIISYYVSRYFTRPLMLVIKWDGGEFRIKFSELHLTVAELKSYLEGKVIIDK